MNIPINYLGVVVATVAAMAIGFAWYSKALFGKAWMKEAGLTETKLKEANKNMGSMYALSSLGALVMAYVLAHFAYLAGVADLIGGLSLGFWAWLGFVATVLLTMVLFDGKSWKWYAITAGYQLVSLLLMGGILAMWR